MPVMLWLRICTAGCSPGLLPGSMRALRYCCFVLVKKKKKKSIEILQIKVDSKTVFANFISPGSTLLHTNNCVTAQQIALCTVPKLIKIFTLSVFWETILNILVLQYLTAYL